MKTLNIKITNLETGEELINENTNAIICGIGDNDGECAIISNINGNLKSILGALDSVEKAKRQTIMGNPILKKIGETFGSMFDDASKDEKGEDENA